MHDFDEHGLFELNPKPSCLIDCADARLYGLKLAARELLELDSAGPSGVASGFVWDAPLRAELLAQRAAAGRVLVTRLARSAACRWSRAAGRAARSATGPARPAPAAVHPALRGGQP